MPFVAVPAFPRVDAYNDTHDGGRPGRYGYMQVSLDTVREYLNHGDSWGSPICWQDATLEESGDSGTEVERDEGLGNFLQIFGDWNIEIGSWRLMDYTRKAGSYERALERYGNKKGKKVLECSKCLSKKGWHNAKTIENAAPCFQAVEGN